jgi:hypothetical protein
LHNFGLMPDAQIRRSMRVLMQEVMPRVRAGQPSRASNSSAIAGAVG